MSNIIYPSLPVILGLRIMFPIVILRYPLFGFLGSMFLDNIDWFSFGVDNRNEYLDYQLIDKLLDIYFLSFGLLAALRWREKVAKWLAVGTYSYRLVGFFIFVLGVDERVFVFFPNVFETFFVFYLVFRLFEKRIALFRGWRDYLVILPLILIPKFVQEVIHLSSVSKEPALVYFETNKEIIVVSIYLLCLGVALLWRLNSGVKKKASRKR